MSDWPLGGYWAKNMVGLYSPLVTVFRAGGGLRIFGGEKKNKSIFGFFLIFGLWTPKFLGFHPKIGFCMKFPPWGRVLRSNKNV